MAIVNRHLAHVETVFLLPDPAHALVSSSLVRQVAALGGDVSPFVPPAVARFLDTGARASDLPAVVARPQAAPIRAPVALTTVRTHRPARSSSTCATSSTTPARCASTRSTCPRPQKWGEGLVAVAEGEPVVVDVRLESVHEGILATGTHRHRVRRHLRTLPHRHRRARRSRVSGAFRVSWRWKQLTSRFKTTTWILKLWSGMRSSWRFRFSRCVSRIAPASIRLRASG